MGDIYFSRSAVSSLRNMEVSEARRIVCVLERIRVRPERYLRRLVSDPAYRLRVEMGYLYMDLSEDDLVVLMISVQGLGKVM